MSWHLTDDVELYAARAHALLATRPAHNTVALTGIDAVRAGRRLDEQAVYGWYEDGPLVTGAVSLTPPWELLLAEVPAGTVAGLVGALRDRGTAVQGVAGQAAVVQAFAAAWTQADSCSATTSGRQRLHRLGSLQQPRPLPPGRARAACESDTATAMAWFTAFQLEAGVHAVDAAPVVRDRVAAGLLWLWQDPAGQPVAMAARNRATCGVARLGPVYTPIAQRCHGYGAAVTAACTADALRSGAREVVLFTDLANPTSNGVYRRLGYLPLRDDEVVAFTPA